MANHSNFMMALRKSLIVSVDMVCTCSYIHILIYTNIYTCSYIYELNHILLHILIHILINILIHILIHMLVHILRHMLYIRTTLVNTTPVWRLN